MPYKDKEKAKENKRDYMRRFRNDCREEYNSSQRTFQKDWRRRNKDKVQVYNKAKVRNGIVRRSHRKAILKISDSYVMTMVRRQPGKSISLKRVEILVFRIKKILRQIKNNEKQN